MAACAVSYSLTAWAKPLFAPDTRYYYAMALHFGGASQEEAAATVAAQSALSGWESPGPDQLFGWGLVQPRVVYPALATPFVKLFGVWGLAVVSGMALFALVLALTTLLLRRYGAIPAVGVVLLLLSSTQILFNSTAMLTESLSALWTTLIAAVAFRHVRDPRRIYLIGLFALTVVSAFTRQATLIPAAALLSAWLLGLILRRDHRWAGPAWVVTLTAVGLQVLQGWIFPTFSQKKQYLHMTNSDSLGEALAATPDLVWHIASTNARQWAGVDLAVPLLIVVMTVSVVVFWRRPESHLVLGAVAASALYNVTNGTPVGIRYAMPGLVFYALAAGQLLAACAGVMSSSIRNDAVRTQGGESAPPSE